MFLLKCFFDMLLLITVFLVRDSLFAIKINCGTGAEIGKPYNIICTELPGNPENGIRIFRDDKNLNIIQCFKDKICLATDANRYDVVSPHTTELKLTILNVTEDDINKKYYCIDNDTKPSTPPSEHCTLKEFTATTDIVTDCGAGAEIGKSYDIKCTNLPESPVYGIKIFRDDMNSPIIHCSKTDKNCTSIVTDEYGVVSLHNGELKFTILTVDLNDIDKKYYCIDTTDKPSTPPPKACKLSEYSGEPFPTWAIVIIVIVCVAGCGGCIVIGVCVWKKKNKEKNEKGQTGKEQENKELNPIGSGNKT